jgi:flagellar biosynthesis protein
MSARAGEPQRVPARAVAIRYDGRARGGAPDEVPRVVAKGQARIAEAIVGLAREHGIPIREDRDLVALLACCEPGAPIPTELYTAVAELIAWLFRANAELAASGAPERERGARG